MLIGYGVREGREITAGFLNRVRDETGGRVLDLRCCRRGVGQPSGTYYPGRSGPCFVRRGWLGLVSGAEKHTEGGWSEREDLWDPQEMGMQGRLAGVLYRKDEDKAGEGSGQTGNYFHFL